jgi:hypothetical protein
MTIEFRHDVDQVLRDATSRHKPVALPGNSLGEEGVGLGLAQRFVAIMLS